MQYFLAEHLSVRFYAIVPYLIFSFIKFKLIYPYELFYHVTAIYTRTVPAELPVGTETVLRTLAIWGEFLHLIAMQKASGSKADKHFAETAEAEVPAFPQR